MCLLVDCGSSGNRGLLSEGFEHFMPAPRLTVIAVLDLYPGNCAVAGIGSVLVLPYDALEILFARKAEQLIKGFVGVTATVRVVDPGTIERSQGKAKRVIDRRPKT